jgi:hypothetical protein
MVVGAVWYSQGVFGKTWGSLAGVKMDRKPETNEMARLLGLTFLASLLMAYILAHLVFLSHSFYNHSFMQDAVTTAFWAWLGFVATRLLVHDLYEGRRKKLTLLNVSHELVTLIIMGLILGWLHP